MLRNTNIKIGGLIPVYRSDTGIDGHLIPQAGTSGPSIMAAVIGLPGGPTGQWMYWVESSNFPPGFWPLSEEGTGQRGPYHTGAYQAVLGIYKNGVRIGSLSVYMVVGDAAANTASAYGTIWTSHSSDGQTWSQERPAKAPGPGQASKRIGWRTCGAIDNWRVQRFRWLSDVNIAVLRLNVVIEPMMTRPV